METRLRFAQKLTTLAGWLPASLRRRFSDELEDVLAERLAAAAERGWPALLWAALYELLLLPGLYAREKAPHIFRRGMPMSKPSIFDDRKEPTPWGWALVALIPFLFGPFGWVVEQIYWLVTKTGVPINGPFAIQAVVYIYLVLIVLISAVMVVAWVKGFPAWCYGLGMIYFLFSLYLSNVAMPGLTLFGYTFPSNQSLGLLALVPLAGVSTAALIVTRKDIARPFIQGARGLREDFTRLSFGLFGFTPFFIWIMFDEVHGEELFLRFISLFLGGCALAYLRARRVALGMGAMLLGLVLTYSLSAVYLWWYWDGRYVEYLPEPIDGLSNMIGTMTCALPVIIVTLGPWLIYRIIVRRRKAA